MRVRSRVARSADDAEAGQVMILAIAFGLLALALVLVIASASAVHIERKQLLALADAAALDAADALDLDAFYDLGPGEVDDTRGYSVPLTDQGVRDAASAHLVAAPSAAGITGLAIGEPTGTPDGTTAQVTLTARARPPFVPWALVGWSDGIPLRVTSSARAG